MRAAGDFAMVDEFYPDNRPIPGIDAVILGGETGPGARPLHPDWVRSVRDQCAAAEVPFFFKGWGKHIPSKTDLMEPGSSEYSKDVFPTTFRGLKAGRLLDGRTHDDLPWRVA